MTTKHSLHLGRYLGIDVFVHWTFSLLILWVALFAGEMKLFLGGPGPAIFFVLAVFGCVLLHEFGHSLAARRYGIGTRKITLLPIGGVAELERMPRDPKQELVVAVAGPAVNVVIALLLGFAGTLGGWLFASEIGSLGHLLTQLFVTNIVLIIFNMIPAFPMDGGRVLRAFLSMRKGHLRATEIAAGIGQSFAFLLGLLGVLNFTTQPMLVILALFVWRAASMERDMVRAQAGYRGFFEHFRSPSGFEGFRQDQSRTYTQSGDGELVEIIPPESPTGVRRPVAVRIVRKNWATE